MKVAYIDTSVLTAIVFDEPGSAEFARRLNAFSRLIASNLLEAELRAVFARENLPFQESSIAGIEWIMPSRTLTPEISLVLDTGYLRGADLWHVASALYVSSESERLSFATLNVRQGVVAEALGFPLPWGTSLD